MTEEAEKKSGRALAASDLITLPYRLTGDRLSDILPFFGDLKDKLERSRIKIAFPAYVAFMLFFSILASASVFAATLAITLLIFAPLILAVMLSVAFALLAGSIVLTIFYAYPSLAADSRKRLLDEELPYVASHMAVLSQAGLPPEAMFHSLALTETRRVRSIASEEAKDIVRDVYALGFDIVSAMVRCIRRSPSQKFSGFVDGMIGVTMSGGDLSKFFLNAARGFMDSARIAGRQLIETLGGIAEAYVSLMVVFPLVAIVMMAVMGVIGGSLGRFSIIFTMYLLAYFILPTLVMILLIYLDSIMPPR